MIPLRAGAFATLLRGVAGVHAPLRCQVPTTIQAIPVFPGATRQSDQEEEQLGTGSEGRVYRVKAPTLIVWGREDRLIPIENAALWQEGIPHARLAPIERCGHVPHRERPEELTRLVIDFLTGGS